MGCDIEFEPVGSYTLLCMACYAMPPFGSDRFKERIAMEIRNTPAVVTAAICAAAPRIAPLINHAVAASQRKDSI
jgi:hypothetical protein